MHISDGNSRPPACARGDTTTHRDHCTFAGHQHGPVQTDGTVWPSPMQFPGPESSHPAVSESSIFSEVQLERPLRIFHLHRGINLSYDRRSEKRVLRSCWGRCPSSHLRLSLQSRSDRASVFCPPENHARSR